MSPSSPGRWACRCSGRVRDVRQQIGEGDLVLLDGGEAIAFVRPTTAVERSVRDQARPTARSGAPNMPRCARICRRSPGTATRITVMVNAGLRDDVAALGMTGADGIGLFRTEFQFLVSATLPRRESQQRLYRSVLDAAGDKPVIFRTVDVGGDKALPYLHTDEQWRGESGDGLARAAARARPRRADEGAGPRPARGGGGPRAQRHVPDGLGALGVRRRRRRWSRSSAPGSPTARSCCRATIRYGAMLEVPALAEMLDMLLPKLDFLSIGTNDLTQFLFAADRSNPRSPSATTGCRRRSCASCGGSCARPTRPTCRSASAARWAGGRSRRWR